MLEECQSQEQKLPFPRSLLSNFLDRGDELLHYRTLALLDFSTQHPLLFRL
jgi:hypothetical protein